MSENFPVIVNKEYGSLTAEERSAYAGCWLALRVAGTGEGPHNYRTERSPVIAAGKDIQDCQNGVIARSEDPSSVGYVFVH
ncbi:MAG: hypothetical protein HYW25_05495 [Candidatus Aenigmarchaeota archaeon]|nr:hypothetical protein [Candidatus Aenigmarchaeota archaeon]